MCCSPTPSPILKPLTHVHFHPSPQIIQYSRTPVINSPTSTEHPTPHDFPMLQPYYLFHHQIVSVTTTSSTFSELILRQYAQSTLKLYAAALKHFLDWSSQTTLQPNPNQITNYIQAYLLQLASYTSPSSARTLLSSLKLAHTAKNLAFCPTPTYWLAASSVTSLAHHRPRSWFSLAWLSPSATNDTLPM